jgi:hypothetical protein
VARRRAFNAADIGGVSPRGGDGMNSNEFVEWRIAGAILLKVMREYHGALPIGIRKGIRAARLNGTLPPRSVSEMDLCVLENIKVFSSPPQ